MKFNILTDYAESREHPDWPTSVPWELVEPHRRQASLNHSQSLEILNARGGLSWQELWCVLNDRDLDAISDKIINNEMAVGYIKSRIDALAAAAKPSRPVEAGPTDTQILDWLDIQRKKQAVQISCCNGLFDTLQSDACISWETDTEYKEWSGKGIREAAISAMRECNAVPVPPADTHRCNCVCHSPVSSRAYCEHCKGINELGTRRPWKPKRGEPGRNSNETKYRQCLIAIGTRTEAGSSTEYMRVVNGLPPVKASLLARSTAHAVWCAAESSTSAGSFVREIKRKE